MKKIGRGVTISARPRLQVKPQQVKKLGNHVAVILPIRLVSEKRERPFMYVGSRGVRSPAGKSVGVVRCES